MVRPSSCLVLACALAALLIVMPAAAYPRYQNNYFRDRQYDPDEIMDLLSRLNTLMQLEHKMETDKRGLDLGLGRGYSGAIQAKHLMGLAAANYADGPGRRRRDTSH
ncbi:diuretic hormone class 2 isoform X2 [Plutella xylostella]|uniref:diuretic hormone class 2 isoform X2 n=1 Tax=Plutella xylostella TaxID=51655 RepID=UPI0020326C91|nr:diuretic hormone class 2 isoform X2 [Plutella xylostella]